MSNTDYTNIDNAFAFCFDALQTDVFPESSEGNELWETIIIIVGSELEKNPTPDNNPYPVVTKYIHMAYGIYQGLELAKNREISMPELIESLFVINGFERRANTYYLRNLN
ncbi:hypothetical protein [uncultured Imperialibacter sp.]|uniref:hypothetical protein n=1 Tax=uncultured Imperialibacter sp. TaxID=1672639 RepID=UPI0030D941CE|tara:strand:+ start:17220 stop:17552 length:333 start_codon:yes stop_codon:yes gene_type:complete